MIFLKGTGRNLSTDFLAAHPIVRNYVWMMGQYRERMLDGKDLTVTRIFKLGHRSHGCITEFDGASSHGGIDWRTWDLGDFGHRPEVFDNLSWERNRDRWKAYGFVLRDHINEYLLNQDSLYVLAFDPHDDLEEPKHGKPAWHNQHFHSHMKKKESRDEHIHESVEKSNTSSR